MEEGHKAVDFGPVGDMVGRVAGQAAVICASSNLGERTADQVVHHGDTLGAKACGVIREQQIVVNQGGPVADLYKYILAHFQVVDNFCTVRWGVVVEKVLGDPGALGLPVQPQTAGAVVDVIAADDGINSGMELDAADFGTIQLLLIIDVVNVIVLNQGEGTAEMAYDARLAAVMDVAVPYDVGADGLLVPTFVDGTADDVPFVLGSALFGVVAPLVLIAGLQILSNGDAAASCLENFTVLNDPALAPMGTDHAILEGRGWSPGAGAAADSETIQGDVIPASLAGEKTIPADIDFNTMLLWIPSTEICENNRCFFTNLGIPAAGGQVFAAVQRPGSGPAISKKNLLQGFCFIERTFIQVYFAGVDYPAAIVPVACHLLLVRVEIAK